ncbi:cation:proton antiporter [Paracrocinitomix mangrovi]|uniref:cation:proton antiporter domain-containing protein n=1 Tax=Paracrocinitomix mangrovi TaxID=2862509 RepID=UPI001C8DCF05|nr:cation:proton antiporter [Paracrocinitomix mangrovi]UKN00630.1 cation:proton antiporter [Paracrocinitomix mangrovi]
METYSLIIGISGIIIISFLFNIISKKTNIPSVLLLIILGVVIQQFVPEKWNTDEYADLDTLEIIGNIGLVMIVLEAALDLKLAKEKMGLIINSFLVALVALVLSSAAIGAIIYFMVPNADTFLKSLTYAVPLSIMSSAIIIPSVGGLTGMKKEFMVYESTFSDILGIMAFYFLIGAEEGETGGEIALSIVLNILVTVVVSIILAYVLTYIFQKLKSQVKLFLIISLLMLMYALGKKLHLSSLLIILAFGLVLNNTQLFFRGRLEKYMNEEKVKPIMHDFHILTLESAFVIRTFFFVLFGMFITLDTIFNLNVTLVSLAILGALFGVRFLVLKLIVRTDIVPQLFLAPRGLITILLFFVIGAHPSFVIKDFNPGILLFVIMISSLIMTWALIRYRGQKVADVIFSQLPGKRIDEDNDGINDASEDDVETNVEKQDFNNF